MSPIDLDERLTQAGFGELVGISQPAVSDLVNRGVLPPDATARAWLLAYCARLREQAAGRLSADGDGPDLAHERALLARAQREGQEIKNAISLGAYAPIELLNDVLATASQAIVDRLDQVPASMRRVCPDLPPAAFDAVMRELASARSEWVRKTLSLLDDMLDETDRPDEDDAPTEAGAADDTHDNPLE